MMFSKKQLGLMLSLSLLLSACWKPETNNEKREAATFTISSFDGKDETPGDLKTKWKYPTYKIMNYRLCLEDQSTTSKARNQKFAVIDPDNNQTLIDSSTDSNGCIFWKENIKYNYFAKKAYFLEVKRLVRATGAHGGEREFTFYINPWAQERDEKNSVVYEKDAKEKRIPVDPAKIVPKAKEFAALSGELEEKPRIWLSDFSMQILKDFTESSKGVGALKFTLSFKPQIQLYRTDGTFKRMPIEVGHFSIFSHLLANEVGSKGNQKAILTSDAAPALGSINRNGTVQIDQRKILRVRATSGNLELALRVEPMDGPSSVSAFEGVYQMSEAQNLAGKSSPYMKTEILNNDSFKLNQYLETSANYEELLKSKHLLKADPYTFTVARPRYLKVGPGETATKREVEYMVATCAIDNILGSPVGEGVKFIVQMPTGEYKDVYSDNQGCIRWDWHLTHYYYAPEQFFSEDVKIYNENHVQIGVKRFAINPWDDKFTFGWDRLEMDEKFFDRIAKRDLIPSKFYIDQFSYHTLRFRYEIDRFMNLQVKKTILLELRPQVLRYSGIVGGRKVTEDIRDGIYLLKVAIQKDYLDPAEKNVFIKNRNGKNKTSQKRDIAKKYYVDVASKLVQVFDGHIITPVELSMSDLRLMRVRSQFLIQLETVDEEKVQVSNIMDEKIWPSLRKNRGMGNKSDAAEDDDRKEAIRENLVKEKKQERTKKLNEILSWLNTKSVYSPDFLEKSGLSEADYAELKKRLEVNDFSAFDMSPLTNPDQYIDHNAGIKKRTFTGPMIFLSNAYSDSVRPTDSLNEVYCETNDCNYIEQFRQDQGYSKPSRSYEHNKYFGSIAHLANTSVDDFISKKLEIDKNYFDKMPEVSSLGNYASIFNLKLVSMKDERFLSLKDDCDIQTEDCRISTALQIPFASMPLVLKEYQPQWGGRKELNLRPIFQNFVPSTLSVQVRKQIGENFTAKSFEEIWLGNKKEPHHLSSRYAEWFCYMITNDNIEGRMVSQNLQSVYKDCLRSYDANPQSFIFVDRKLRVNKTGSYEFRGGKQMNLNVGSSFSIGHSTSASISTGTEGFDIMSAFPVGNIAKKMIKPLSVKFGASESYSSSDGTSVSEQTYLVMQMANFVVDLASYERCFILTPHQDWLKKTKVMLAHSRENLKSNGVMICSGDIVNDPVNVMESYFYFTQHFTEGDMLDQYDLYNHPWLLALRGVRDFTNFAKLLRKQSDKNDVKWSDGLNPLNLLKSDYVSPTDKVVDKTGWPLDKMAETYRNVLPSFPGLYTLVHQNEFIQDYPWDIEHTDASFFSSPGFDDVGGEAAIGNKKAK